MTQTQNDSHTQLKTRNVLHTLTHNTRWDDHKKTQSKKQVFLKKTESNTQNKVSKIHNEPSNWKIEFIKLVFYYSWLLSQTNLN